MLEIKAKIILETNDDELCTRCRFVYNPFTSPFCLLFVENLENGNKDSVFRCEKCKKYEIAGDDNAEQ